MTRRRAIRRSRAGLTIVEVMVAMAILLIMVATTGAVLANALEIRKVLEDRDSTTRAARVALGTIRRNLQLAYLTDQVSPTFTYQTVFVGLDGRTDSIFYATRAHQRLYRDSRESDAAEISLWAETSRASRRGYTLYQRESQRVDEEPDEGGRVLPLAHQVRTFELRYLDGTQDVWREEWDTRSVDQANRLPRAVQIGLVLVGVDPADSERTIDLPFFTTVLLEYADPLPRGDMGALLGVGGGGGSQPTQPTTNFGGQGGLPGGAQIPGGIRGGNLGGRQ